MLPGDHFKIVTKSADNLAAGESHLLPGPERRRQRRNESQRRAFLLLDNTCVMSGLYTHGPNLTGGGSVLTTILEFWMKLSFQVSTEQKIAQSDYSLEVAI